MEINTDWTASNLFSPSKARAQQAQAKDWALVDDWLRKIGTRLSFERNEETLEALLQLANLNENADEQRKLIEQVERNSLGHIREKISHQDDTYQLVLAHINDNGHETLDELAESSALLQSASITQTAENLSDLIAQHFEASEQLNRVEGQVEVLKREQERMADLMREIKTLSLNAPANLPEDTAEWTRNSKHLKAKVGEYNERLSTFKATSTQSLDVEDVSRHSKLLRDEQQQLENLTSQLVAFESLPPNADAASRKLESARSELRALMVRRDQLFESLMDRG